MVCLIYLDFVFHNCQDNAAKKLCCLVYYLNKRELKHKLTERQDANLPLSYWHNSTKCNISLSQSLNQLVYLHWLNLAPSIQYQVHKVRKTLKDSKLLTWEKAYELPSDQKTNLEVFYAATKLSSVLAQLPTLIQNGNFFSQVCFLALDNRWDW